MPPRKFQIGEAVLVDPLGNKVTMVPRKWRNKSVVVVGYKRGSGGYSYYRVNDGQGNSRWFESTLLERPDDFEECISTLPDSFGEMILVRKPVKGHFLIRGKDRFSKKKIYKGADEAQRTLLSFSLSDKVSDYSKSKIRDIYGVDVDDVPHTHAGAQIVLYDELRRKRPSGLRLKRGITRHIAYNKLSKMDQITKGKLLDSLVRRAEEYVSGISGRKDTIDRSTLESIVSSAEDWEDIQSKILFYLYSNLDRITKASLRSGYINRLIKENFPELESHSRGVVASLIEEDIGPIEGLPPTSWRS